MDNHLEVRKYSYDWNQSHDQATVLLKVPYETLEEDIVVVIDGSYLLAGVRDQPPLIKGRLYDRVDSKSSWQLEMRRTGRQARERTTSTTSTASTRFSYALVSDPEISSSFAASLEGGPLSDADEAMSYSSTLSSPAAADERGLPPSRQTGVRTQSNVATSRSVSPGFAFRSMTSSASSIESLHSIHSGRLLTLHLEKEHSAIWPSLIVGPVPESLSPLVSDPAIYQTSHELEHQFNMDPTSLVLLALEFSDIRSNKEEAFEYLIRAWRRAHLPMATMRLAKDYFPTHTQFEHFPTEDNPQRDSHSFYFQCIGGSDGLAQLYLELGLLHLDGAASKLLSASRSTLSSLRMPDKSPPSQNEGDEWRQDREAASKYFKRAKILQPSLEVPSLPSHDDGLLQSAAEELEMPSIELQPSAPESVVDDPHTEVDPPGMRRRRKKEELIMLRDRGIKAQNNIDNAWYLYLPGLVGAGTALLVVGVVGALSFSTWRRNQGS